MVIEAKSHYKVIGTRPIRHDGVDKVTGRAQYGADISLAGMLHGRVLRSPHAHARIKSINADKALAVPGVKAVVTGADLPPAEDKTIMTAEGPANMKFLSNNVLAADKVVYKGHPVAAIAATSAHIAEEALALIEVDYEVLPPLLNVREAMRPEAPVIHETVRTSSMGQTGDTPSNIASHLRFARGDLEAGFAEADVVVEREFNTVMVHQGYIEPHNGTAYWNPDGNLTIWSSTQGAFTARDQVAGVLQVPVSKIKVVPMEIGGGFGGKIPVYLEPVAALLSKKTGKPVKLTMDRQAVFDSTGPTSGTNIRVKVGAKNDGTITAGTCELAFEAGGYPGSPVGAAAMCAFSCYNIPNGQVDGYDVVVNKPKVAAYRAPGAPQAAFAVEQVMDEVAEKIGMDPLQFRLKNAVKEGDRRIEGAQYPRIGYIETVEAALNTDHWKSPIEGPNKGRGTAVGFWFNIGFKSSVNVSVHNDGTVALIEGSTDIGGTRASIAMQLAETLGIPAEDVKPTVVDTDSVGYNDVTGGSRTTFATGWAAYEAGMKLRDLLRERAAKIWECDITDVVYEDGNLRCLKDDEKKMSFKELAGKLNHTGGGISTSANVLPMQAGGAFAAHIVDVEVDPDTGKTEVLRYTAVQDAGTAIHPSYVEGQIQGGAVQGIGWALNEEYYYDDEGRMANSSFLDYRMPTTLDLPMIDTIIIEVPNPGHPYGVRGVGEVPIVPPTPAIANAVYRATGHRFTDLPMSPRHIVEALHDLK
jgi:CO/xanthine dehydrogenase Mo-binding subunit